MPDTNQLIEIHKVIAPYIGGGFTGAILTNVVLVIRNRKQPVRKKLNVTYVDLPRIMKGYEAFISVHSRDDGGKAKSQVFQKLAIIRLELTNTDDQDIEKFDIGITLPEGTEAIGFQGESHDKKHLIVPAQEVTMDARFKELDFDLKPFNRGDKYSITLVANTREEDLSDKIVVSSATSIRFVASIEVEETRMQSLIEAFMQSPAYFPITKFRGW